MDKIFSAMHLTSSEWDMEQCVHNFNVFERKPWENKIKTKIIYIYIYIYIKIKENRWTKKKRQQY